MIDTKPRLILFLAVLTVSVLPTESWFFDNSCFTWICFLPCPSGFVIDAKGCPTCVCKPDPISPTCPFLLCGKMCITGFRRDEEGCYMCECASSNTPCPKVACGTCVNGFELDEKGCNSCKCKTSDPPPLDSTLKPIEWLIGKWKSTTGLATYPTMTDFKYLEYLEFYHVGQSNLQFTFSGYDPVTLSPMHRESGFIKVNKDGKQVTFCSAHNRGFVEVEEGILEGKSITMASVHLNSISFVKAPPVLQLKRRYALVGDRLEENVYMETGKTTNIIHLRATYDKQV